MDIMLPYSQESCYFQGLHLQYTLQKCKKKKKKLDKIVSPFLMKLLRVILHQG